MNMKKTLSYLAIAAAMLAAFASCDTDYEFPDPDTIPQYQIKIPVVSAKATATNGYSMPGEITALNEDHTRYSIDFRFDANGIDLTKLKIEIEYCSRTILKENAFDGEKEIDLKNKSYAMTVNDVVNDIEYVITASVIPCQEPVLKATAVSNGLTEIAEIDNIAHTIKFFLTSSTFDITNMDITLLFNGRAELGDNTFTNKTVDLSSPYEMLIGDSVETHKYIITAEFLNIPELIPYQQIDVFRVEGDAMMSEEKSSSTDYMFDGVYIKKFNGASAIEHHQVYWSMVGDEAISAHGDFLLFDVSEPVVVAQACVHPYDSYNSHDPLLWAVYAYKASTTIAPDSFSTGSSDWVKIIAGDDRALWDEAMAVRENTDLIGTDADPCTKQQIHGTIEGITIPSARYFAFVMEQNCYQVQPAYYTKQLGWNPTNRWHQCSFTELEVWRYLKNN